MAKWMELLGVEQTTGYKCEECGEVSNDMQIEPLYECSSCGQKYTRSNSSTGAGSGCPNCSRFGKLISNFSCPECQEGPLEEVVAFRCPSGDLYEDEGDLENHLVEEHGWEVLNTLKEAAPE